MSRYRQRADATVFFQARSSRHLSSRPGRALVKVGAVGCHTTRDSNNARPFSTKERVATKHTVLKKHERQRGRYEVVNAPYPLSCVFFTVSIHPYPSAQREHMTPAGMICRNPAPCASLLPADHQRARNHHAAHRWKPRRIGRARPRLLAGLQLLPVLFLSICTAPTDPALPLPLPRRKQKAPTFDTLHHRVRRFPCAALLHPSTKGLHDPGCLAGEETYIPKHKTP